MAGNHRSRCCNVPSHPFSFGVLPEKKVTGILAIGLESQESDMYAGGLEPATRLLGRQRSDPSLKRTRHLDFPSDVGKI